MKPVVAFTVGDYNGIGPEVVLKSILRSDVRALCTPLLVGPMEVFEGYARRYALPLRFRPFPSHGRTSSRTLAVFESSPLVAVHVRPGAVSARAGAAAGKAIEQAVRLVQHGFADAVVTAPVSKQALHRAGFHVPGQTEMLQRLTNSRAVAMMLVAQSMRVGLVTIHIPLRAVASTLSIELVFSRIATIHDALRSDWKIRHPRIAVLGLNPHAGEGGDIGMEERRVIIPAMSRLRRRGIHLDGPFSADAFFGRSLHGKYDGIIAMYHDQGLIPLKMSSHGNAVNVSVGLPIVRTSPDHGTAFDIAGKGTADPSSMSAAIRLAVSITQNRRTSRRKRSR